MLSSGVFRSINLPKNTIEYKIEADFKKLRKRQTWIIPTTIITRNAHEETTENSQRACKEE